MSRGQVLLLGLGLLALGAGGYRVLQASGLPDLSAGLTSSLLLVVIVLGWTGTYLVRVLSGRMTFSEQRRRYRSAYDAATDQLLEARFASLSPDEQARLLSELGVSADSGSGAVSHSDPSTSEAPGAPTP